MFNTTAEFEVVKQIKEKVCYLTNNPQRILEEIGTSGGDLEKSVYTLPDGSNIEIGASARVKAPEILFKPDLIGAEFEGVHDVLHYSIQKSDLELRKVFYQNIVLSGGSTLFRGFGDRLLNELKKAAPKDVKIRISAPQERIYSTWIGGSILASLDTFKRIWISRKEYEESGQKAVHRKTFI